MAATVAQLDRARTARPKAWDTLLPSEEGGPWQVWVRRKGPGYWLMRYATRLSRLLGEDVSNPNGMEEGGTVETEDEARDLCRIIYERAGGRYAVTYTPLVVGRVYPFEGVLAAGDKRFKPPRRFDPFKVFDFSATDAVREQARHVLISVDELREIRETRAILTGALPTAEPRL
jgi:hypothetical protein